MSLFLSMTSGCQVRRRLHGSVERLARSLAIMVITRLGREMSGVPAENLFSEVEIKARCLANTPSYTQPTHNLREPCG